MVDTAAKNAGSNYYVRPLQEGMGQAVAERTVLRRLPSGEFETWGDVAHRVALGNSMLVPPVSKTEYYSADNECVRMQTAIAKATLLMSGRHLQHGDADQKNRNIEVFSNCATSAASFLTFMLLLNGAGVGRCYDDDVIVTNWDNAPNLRCVISMNHPDFTWGQDEDVRDARHKYAGPTVVWHEVADTREGWSKAIEIWEVMAYQKIYRDHTLVLDFSGVRARNAPIMGMQGRPSSGPKPLMSAMLKCATIKGASMAPWKQAMYVDHYLAECVLVGGARRAARMSTKTWRDPGVLDFIRVKRPVEYAGMSMEEVIAFRAERTASKQPTLFPFLWSSNNSVTVDVEFWDSANMHRSNPSAKLTTMQRHAVRVLDALAQAAYGDGTGEPGIINSDLLVRNDSGWSGLTDGGFVGSKKYEVEENTRLMLAQLARITAKKPFVMITNPCGEISLSLLGGYCVIADVVPYHADTLMEAEDAFRIAARALIRVNLMDNLYARETIRTNRIGVGITGIHEFAWKFFRVGFRDLVKPDFEGYFSRDDDKIATHSSPAVRAAGFWLTLARFSRAVQEEAISYSKELCVNAPHTALTIKPAGCMTPDTEIRTTDGIKTIRSIFADNGFSNLEDLEAGTWLEPTVDTYVYDETNTARRVTKLYVNGVRTVFEVIFDDGLTINLTGNHCLKTTDGFNRVDHMINSTTHEVVQFSNNEKKTQMKILRILELEPAFTVDMEVDESHTYQFSNGCVSHNTTSKLFGLTEGWHLPAMAWYLRWVQFRHDDPLVQEYKSRGYPTRELTTYSGTIIVGFPTQPVIGELGMGDKLVTASEATMEEQYEWIRLGEKFWIKGTDHNCNPLHKDGEDVGNQISYTAKYLPAALPYDKFFDTLLSDQSGIRCCSVMPVEESAAYEYLPEQSIDKAEYEGMMRAINNVAVVEDIDVDTMLCAGGACPIDIQRGPKV